VDRNAQAVTQMHLQVFKPSRLAGYSLGVRTQLEHDCQSHTLPAQPEWLSVVCLCVCPMVQCPANLALTPGL
jgi:hypothetical protein